jgi:hypothetical protein
VLLASTLELFGFKAQSDVSNGLSISVVIVADSQVCRTGGVFADRLADRKPNCVAVFLIIWFKL